MIQDEQAYKISKSRAEKFEKALADLSQNKAQYKNIDPRFLEVHKNTLLTQLNRIKSEIREDEQENLLPKIAKIQRLEEAKKLASFDGLNVPKVEELLHQIRVIAERYQIILYLASTGRYSAKDIAEIFNWQSKNINADINRNLIDHLKAYLGLDSKSRLGINNLRTILYKAGYMVEYDDVKHDDGNLAKILHNHLTENSRVE